MTRAPQPDLFASEAKAAAAAPAQRAATHGLTISVRGQAALSPEQRKYNQLVAKVEKARAELQSWEEAGPRFAQDHDRLMRPLMVELSAQRRLLALNLAELLARDGLTKKDRSTLARRLCDEAAGLVQSEFIDEAAAAELEALHDRYAEVPLADERQEALDEVKGMIEAMSGVDLGDARFESEEELLRHAQERVQAAAAAGHEVPPFPFGAQAQQRQAEPQAKRPTAGQRKRQQQEEKMAQEAALAAQSVRDVFRRLASALHPDRASDEDDRARRTALMQRVNQAYEKQDLLALFSLQLEIEQIDPEHLARASAERIGHYNRVLAEQLAELQHEIRQRAAAFAMEYGVEPWRKLNPHKLGVFLEEDLRGIRGALNHVAMDLQQLGQPAGVKRFIKQEREQQRFEDDGAFDLLF
jgi:hypothetical protein